MNNVKFKALKFLLSSLFELLVCSWSKGGTICVSESNCIDESKFFLLFFCNLAKKKHGEHTFTSLKQTALNEKGLKGLQITQMWLCNCAYLWLIYNAVRDSVHTWMNQKRKLKKRRKKHSESLTHSWGTFASCLVTRRSFLCRAQRAICAENWLGELLITWRLSHEEAQLSGSEVLRWKRAFAAQTGSLVQVHISLSSGRRPLVSAALV